MQSRDGERRPEDQKAPRTQKEQKAEQGGAILFLIAPNSLGIHVVGQEFRNFPHWVVK